MALALTQYKAEFCNGNYPNSINHNEKKGLSELRTTYWNLKSGTLIR